MIAQKLKKYLLILLGSIALVIGIIGIFIPVLPTTPLLLLSAYCFLHSSSRLYIWLIHHKILGPYIYNYLTYKAISRTSKISALIFLWLTLMISMVIISSIHIRIFLLLVGTGVSIHLITLKTLSLEELHGDKPKYN